jgi:perosamine synthetase
MSTTSDPRTPEPGAGAIIPLAVPQMGGNEWRYIKECLDTNWVSYAGPFVARFELELAARSGAAHAVALASGTAALHLALLMAGVEADDEVVMPGITFVSPANAVRYCGAWPTFVDISARDWQMDVDKLASFLAGECRVRAGRLYNRSTGRRVSALMLVHLLGGMGDVDAVAELAARYDLPLIEDAAECLAATYKGRPIGAPLPAADVPLRLVATSFNGNKIITTGGGGALLANDEGIAHQGRHLSTTAKADRITFFHDRVGYNYRMTNLAAAMGVAQLERLDEYAAVKRAIAARYAQAFEGSPHAVLHKEPAHCRSEFWLYTLLLDRPSLPLVHELGRQGIEARPVWIPPYRLPAFRDRCAVYACDFGEEFHAGAISIPSSVGLQESQQARVIDTVLALLAGGRG